MKRYQLNYELNEARLEIEDLKEYTVSLIDKQIIKLLDKLVIINEELVKNYKPIDKGDDI